MDFDGKKPVTKTANFSNLFWFYSTYINGEKKMSKIMQSLCGILLIQTFNSSICPLFYIIATLQIIAFFLDHIFLLEAR